jgi:hypothetical protein
MTTSQMERQKVLGVVNSLSWKTNIQIAAEVEAETWIGS